MRAAEVPGAVDLRLGKVGSDAHEGRFDHPVARAEQEHRRLGHHDGGNEGGRPAPALRSIGLSMRVAILSDIHGNKQALEAVLADAATTRPARCGAWAISWATGPIPTPACSWRASTSVCLVGNHDLAVRGDLPMHEFSRGAAVAAAWTRETIGESELEWLGGLEPADLGQDVGLFHASPRDRCGSTSRCRPTSASAPSAHRVCLVGHTHVALAFSRDEGEPTTGQTRHGETELDIGRGEWLISGSVGQPRDGDPRAGLAAARHRPLDGLLAPGRVRHRRRRGGDPGRQAARIARRAPAFRPMIQQIGD